ncbi:MAG TPA: hypothetical protein VLM79_24645 [Kofleriaceae bacterium]|nr:hypothetical protein [Kofleriaceae bacterium]
MSILSKLTVGAVAVLGAYALRGKRRETEAPAEDKTTSKRGTTAKTTSKAKVTAGNSTGRTGKPAKAKARPRKRPRSASAKRAHAT